MKMTCPERVVFRAINLARWLPLLFVVWLVATNAPGQEPRPPLKPPDRSSPRAALKTFLEAGDAVGVFLTRQYLPSPSRAKYQQLTSLAEAAVRCLDLSEMSSATHRKAGQSAALALYDTLNRIQLPLDDQIPGADQLNLFIGTNVIRYVIPNTEIALERTRSERRSGEFLFSPDTVAKAGNFYERVRGLPYLRPVPNENLKEIIVSGGGWLVPYRWVQAMPAWLRAPFGGQAVWKWLGLILILSACALSMRLVLLLSRRGSPEHPLLRAITQAALPAFLLLATPAVAYLTLIQLNLVGGVGSTIAAATTTIMFLAGAWIAWRIAPVVAEAIIASPEIAPESMDAHLIRICTRLLASFVGIGLLVMGADRLGLPVYGIIAGLGVGGLAIALAAQPTIENLIGGLNLFADKPIRIGDLCQYGDAKGTIEAIGIRSTRIRGLDRTLTAIPNSVLSKLPVVNFTQRDRMLLQCLVNIRNETSAEQLRYLLGKIRAMLVGHPRIHPDPARVRLVGFGASSLEIEVFAYVSTSDWAEFLGIREDVLLRIMDIVKDSGTGFAFPSQTLYFARDGGLDAQRTDAAETQVRQWREEGCLPFPNFSPDQTQRLRGALIYPPPGSPEQPLAAENARNHGEKTDGPPSPTERIISAKAVSS